MEISKIKKYYENPDQYLAEHKDFFSKHSPEKDVDFLIKVLKIKKSDHILDIACGQGRHTTELAKRGFDISGVDFSSSLINKAKQLAQKTKVEPKYYIQDIEILALRHKFDVIYWFFSDFANLDLQTVTSNIAKTLKPNGRLLIDADNHFRLANYLKEHSDCKFRFDTKRKMLIDLTTKTEIPYPDEKDWRIMMAGVGLTITEVLGNYDHSPYSSTSPRLMIITKKISLP